MNRYEIIQLCLVPVIYANVVQIHMSILNNSWVSTGLFSLLFAGLMATFGELEVRDRKERGLL